MDPSDYRRPRHPLSPERSSHSEDEEDSDDMGSSMSQRSRRHQPSWGGMVDSMDSITLPPLRSSDGSSSHSTRLPSITSGYRTHSGGFGRHDREPYAPKIRRLSLADLEAPIYKTKKVVDHSMQVHQAKFEGVDVSEDEIHALEAFGELWAQGRDMGMGETAETSSSTTSSSSTTLRPVIKSEFSQPTPGLDHGRRSPRATDDKDFSVLAMTAMDLD
ncbi:hypothetical protein BGX24_011422 [Mortierella sp. AD032]|nr:hypothetical protein BGX24_011422 [Mortierella sp. AD032]